MLFIYKFRIQSDQYKSCDLLIILLANVSPGQGPRADCLLGVQVDVNEGGGHGLVHACEGDPGAEAGRRPRPRQRLLGVEVDILVIRLCLLLCLLYKTLVNIYSERGEWSLLDISLRNGRISLWKHPVKLSEMVLKV